MGKRRDWALDIIGTDINFVGMDGNRVLCTKSGFAFHVDRSNWPPIKLSPRQCLDPTGYFKFLVRQLHGDLYDLSPTIFKGADVNVDAICKIHGLFSIPAKHFESSRGCPICGYKNIGISNRNNTEDFIKLAEDRHGKRYEYSAVEYSTALTPVSVICREHGEFKTTPTNHLSGRGCSVCGRLSSTKSRMLTQETVLSRFEQVHKEKYDYSFVDYKGDAHEHLSILCKTHGLFSQSYANHNSGKGCPVCSREFSPRFKSGFVKSYLSKNYASLYLIRCFNETENFYKIGITTKPISRRFSGESSLPYSFEVIYLHIDTGGNVWDLELALHKKYKQLKYIPAIPFGGMYECFTYIDLVDYEMNLNTIKSQLCP